MMKRYEDNFAEVHAKVKARILASNVAWALTPQSKTNISSSDLPSRYSYLSAEFVAGGTSVTLYVAADSQFSRDVVTDSDGNEFERFNLTCKVNYPCHGSTDAGVVVARAHFLQQVAMLGAEIIGEFDQTPVYRLYQTKEEKEDRKRKAEEYAMEQKVKALVEANCKGMRVGQERLIGCDSTKGISGGAWTVPIGLKVTELKKFKLIVSPGGETGANLLRVA